MAGTFHILDTAWTGMLAHRLRGDVASHNAANAATPGYARQRVELQARQPWLGPGGVLGSGVEASGVRGLRDELLERTLLGAAADHGAASGRLQVLQAAETAVGIGADDPLQSALDRFFRAASDLAAEPAGGAQREAFLAAAEDLGSTFGRVRGQLAEGRRLLDDRIGGLTGGIQRRIDEIASLNEEIRSLEGGGSRANDLRDRRARLAREVAERIGVNTFSDEAGNLNLMLATGGVLVEGGRAANLTVEPDPANGGLAAPVLVAGSGARTPLDSAVGGELGGLLAARDDELRAAVAALDTLAYELVDDVNTLHRSGFGLDGAGGRDLFAPIAVADGAAAAVVVDAAVSGDPDAIACAQDPAALPGDNRVALALAELADGAVVGGASPGAHWRSTTSALGSGLESAAQRAEHHAARLNQLSTLRESVSGVSIDEEMIELTKAQRAFEAAAKVIQTGDELLETVLSLR